MSNPTADASCMSAIHIGEVPGGAQQSALSLKLHLDEVTWTRWVHRLPVDISYIL